MYIAHRDVFVVNKHDLLNKKVLLYRLSRLLDVDNVFIYISFKFKITKIRPRILLFQNNLNYNTTDHILKSCILKIGYFVVL